MRKLARVAVALATLATFSAPAGASASAHCRSNIAVFMYVHKSLPAYNANGTACQADSHNDADLRVIYPGTWAAAVRLKQNVDPPMAYLGAVLNGLGFVDHVVWLSRRTDPTTGAVTYDSPIFDLPQRAMTGGTLTVSIRLPDDTTDSTCYRTPDATCP